MAPPRGPRSTPTLRGFRGLSPRTLFVLLRQPSDVPPIHRADRKASGHDRQSSRAINQLRFDPEIRQRMPCHRNMDEKAPCTQPHSPVKAPPASEPDCSVRSRQAALAQLVEHIIRNDGVTCSSHVSGTISAFTDVRQRPCELPNPLIFSPPLSASVHAHSRASTPILGYVWGYRSGLQKTYPPDSEAGFFMALTEVAVRNAKPGEKPYKLTDGGGLFLSVTPSGGKLWRLKFRFGGREKLLALGKYPQVSLSAARKARDDAKAKLASGVDPAHEKKMAAIAAKVSAGNTFQSVADDFIAVKLEANGKAKATIEKARWYLAHLTPTVGARPIADIKPAELLSVLKQLEKKGHRETARRTRALASRIFRHGIAHALCDADPAALLNGALAAPIVKHRAAILDPVKLGAFLRDIEEYSGSSVVKIAMQLSPHVFTRPGELRFGRWAEVDWENAVWHVPAERTKLRRPHSVPLSRQSVFLLKMLHVETGGFELMFAGQRTHLKPISENTVNQSFRRMGWSADEVTAHGLRATASTLLNESGKWHIDAIERALAHGHSDAVRGTYARGQHWAERVAMAQWWSDHLDMLREGANVVPIKSHG